MADSFINPIALILFALWLFSTLSEYIGSAHPVESLLEELKYLKTNKGINFDVPIGLLNTIYSHKHVATIVCLNIVTFVLKPKFFSALTLSIYSAYVTVHPNLDFVLHIVIGSMVFMYFCVRGSKNKFSVVLIGFCILYVFNF